MNSTSQDREQWGSGGSGPHSSGSRDVAGVAGARGESGDTETQLCGGLVEGRVTGDCVTSDGSVGGGRGGWGPAELHPL